MLNLVTAGTATSVWRKLLLYGNSGAGKTWRACQVRRPGSGQKVLALLTEANAVQSARHANPDVLLPSWPVMERVAGKDGEPDTSKPAIDPATGQPIVRHYAIKMGEVREVLKAVISREIPDLTAFIFDGLTEVQAMMKDEMLELKKKAVDEGKAKKEALVFSKADWGELNERMRRLMRSLRDLPVDVVTTALADTETEEDGESTVRYTYPSFQGRKLPNQAAAFHNVVAYCYTARGRGEGGASKITRLAMVEGPETIQCKPAYPLTGVLDSPLWEWMDAMAKPPEGSKLGRELTDEEKKALEAEQAKGAEETAKRKEKEDEPEKPRDPDEPNVDLSGGEDAPKDAPKQDEKPKGRRIRRQPR